MQQERVVGTVAAKTWRRYFEAAGALWMSFPMALGVVAVRIHCVASTAHAPCTHHTAHVHAHTMCVCVYHVTM